AVTLATGLSWFGLMDWTGRGVLQLTAWLKGKLREAPQALAARQARSEREVIKKADAVKQARREPVRIEAAPAPVTKSERARLETQIPLFTGAARATAPVVAGRGAGAGPGLHRRDPGSALAPGRVQAEGFQDRREGGRRLSGPGDHPLRDGARARHSRL